MHLIAIVTLFAAVLSVAIANLLVVLLLHDKHKAVYEALGRPSAFYFVGLQWMTNHRYFDWLWSSEPSELNDSDLSRWIQLTKLALIGFLIAFVWLIFAVSI